MAESSVPVVTGSEGPMVCKKHQEPLKIFCKEDRALLCLVCDKSREHTGHTVLPLEEAAADYKKRIQDWITDMRQERKQLLAFKETGTAENTETLEKIKSEIQKAESIFQQAYEFLNEQKQILLTQWEFLEKVTEKRQKEHTVKLSENISYLDSLITEAEERCQRPTTEFLQDVKITLLRLRKRKYQEVAEASSELEGSLDSLIRKNVAVEETLQKIKDEVPFGVTKEEVSSPAGKRKKSRRRNVNAQRSLQGTADSKITYDDDWYDKFFSSPKQDETKKYECLLL